MAIYLVSGKLGSGKTLSAVGRIRDALLAGRRVATNLDLRLEHMLPPYAGRPRPAKGGGGFRQPVNAIRLPDKPTVDHLEAIGCGNESMDEDQNGLIVLDELASWLNSRTFNDPTRKDVIDWLIHSRKKGWDVYFICQHIEQIDKQIRTALVEYLVTCRRLDRMKIPVVGKLINVLTGGLVSGNMPKLHLAVVRYGTTPDAIKADTWFYKGADLYKAYDTRQIFTDATAQERHYPEWYEQLPDGTDVCHPARIEGAASGPFTYLPPWHLGGHAYESPWQRFQARFDRPRPKPAPKPKKELVALLRRLPPDQAMKHWRRLNELGAFDDSTPYPVMRHVRLAQGPSPFEDIRCAQ